MIKIRYISLLLLIVISCRSQDAPVVIYENSSDIAELELDVFLNGVKIDSILIPKIGDQRVQKSIRKQYMIKNDSYRLVIKSIHDNVLIIKHFHDDDKSGSFHVLGVDRNGEFSIDTSSLEFVPGYQ